MARMLGRERRAGCGNFRCRLCGPGDTRRAKRREAREAEREIEADYDHAAPVALALRPWRILREDQ
jgi:hypothetical protein